MKVHSPYPVAHLARLPAKDSPLVSAVLVPRALAYLSIRITFHCEPLRDLAVELFEEAKPNQRGKSLAGVLRSDADGRVGLEFMVPAGRYICAIERQPDTAITTVKDFDQPFLVILPIGRPYFDLDEAPEFDKPGPL